ncbi:hypothetical protein JRO89_XS05G0166000 [Xanthoceras sorbifolium]|uniref:VQ domain-containing protein n=1 Tax=Xanthoceras sorbifolium TaxID=99658 RepID=A0ABQ8I2S8_9ROSI|nr:hypothetical protein JRO89_XS05G0166000 [Xanthoceras sorbifolium]
MVASTTSNKVLSMHKSSHLISKFKPKIRIVHIFAPEIIKTDAANFRELVQRLTGKPTTDQSKGKPKKKRKLPCTSLVHYDDHPNKTMQSEDGTRSDIEENIKEEENDQIIWGNGTSSSSGNFFDGFIQEYLSEYSSHDHNMDVLDQVEDIYFSM